MRSRRSPSDPTDAEWSVSEPLLRPPAATTAWGVRPNRNHPRQMWSDRVLDEARHTADPLHLVHLFGIHSGTAVRYVHAARPGEAQPSIR